MSITSRLAGTRAAGDTPAASTAVARAKPKGSTQNIGWSAPGAPMQSKWDATTAISVGYYGYVYSYRCARTIATTIAGLPFRAGSTADVPTQFHLTSPLARLLGPPPGQPAPEVSSRQLLIHSIVSYLVTGKYAWETPCLPGTKTPVPVALRHPRTGALMRPGTDRRGRLRVDQRLEHRLHRPAHHITGIGGFQHLKQLQQGRLVQGHRVHLLLREFPWSDLAKTHTMAP